MQGKPFHEKLVLENFTAFEHAEFEFCPGLNVIIGENGTGKTHVLKALYSYHSTTGKNYRLHDKLQSVFQVDSAAALKRQKGERSTYAEFGGVVGGKRWEVSIKPVLDPDALRYVSIAITGSEEAITVPLPDPVFIPAIDMMGHTKNYLATAERFNIDFDETLRDVVLQLLSPTLKKLDPEQQKITDELLAILGGNLELEGERFYLVKGDSKFAMPTVAEGLRKIATLIRLIQVGVLVPGSTLFWDEPEVNINPKLMDELVGAILALTRYGVQVFVATHSYVILKEFDLQLGKDDARFFSLSPSESGTTVRTFNNLESLEPNAILEQYGSLYDRELTRATGRPLKREN